MTIDCERDEIRVVTVDGRIAVQSGVANREEALRDFNRVTFRPAELVLELTVAWGDVLEVEVYDQDDQVARRAGRPVVYLDQNKWVQLAQAVNAPEKLATPDLDAASLLAELARKEEVLLPLSSGHWIETGALDRRWREHLATQMVGLSRGWIMRDPLRVTESEIETILGGTKRVPETFTLDSRELYAEPMGRYVPKGDDLPVESVDLLNALTGVQSIMAVLVENERTKDAAGVQAAQQWAAVHTVLSQQINAGPLSRKTKRRMTLEAFIQDLGHGLAEAAQRAGWTTGDFASWTESSADEDLAHVPFLGLRREVTHYRLTNIDDKWDDHDLVDMLFLPCAAAYADHVVCEKKTADYMRRALRKRPEGAAIHTSIVELVEALKGFGSDSP